LHFDVPTRPWGQAVNSESDNKFPFSTGWMHQSDPATNFGFMGQTQASGLLFCVALSGQAQDVPGSENKLKSAFQNL
jgi:hypothetical protein